MKISTQNNQTQFKQINLVQVSKQAFANPDVDSACAKEFYSELKKTCGEKIIHEWGSFTNIFGLGKKRKLACMFEYPSCNIAREELQRPGFNYSLYWLSENTGLDLKDKIDSEKHSFFVLTGKEKDRLASMLSFRHILHLKTLASMMRDMIKLKRPDIAETCYNLLIGVFADKDFKSILQDKPIEKFSIDNLDDIKTIINKLNIE